MKVIGIVLFSGFVMALPVFGAEFERFENAVVVKRGGLVHTIQFLDRGTGDSGADAVRDVLGQLSEALEARGSGMAMVAKLNLYVSDVAGVAGAHEAVAERWKSGERPAITLVPTDLPGGKRAACDAVVASDARPGGVALHEDAAVMPVDRDILYVSGRAASGEIAEATRGTMEQLFGNLTLFGSDADDVVQIKAFLQPMEKVEVMKKEIESFFPKGAVPPIVYVAWNSPSRATEIELIAAAPDSEETDATVSYINPPGDRVSPVFTRVTRVHADKVIFISGLGGGAGTEAEQVKRVFEKLKAAAEGAGSDLRHLAKATYYVSTNEVSKALNEIRPALYDPKRPPAASKIAVPQTGEAVGSVLIDLVAVPVAPGN